jgi:hypothetical protein
VEQITDEVQGMDLTAENVDQVGLALRCPAAGLLLLRRCCAAAALLLVCCCTAAALLLVCCCTAAPPLLRRCWSGAAVALVAQANYVQLQHHAPAIEDQLRRWIPCTAAIVQHMPYDNIMGTTGG